MYDSKTIFCDIDGTLIQHVNPTEKTNQISTVNILPGTLQKIKLWDSKNYNIILTTGRKESLRKITEEELSKVGIIYDKLIMGIGPGDRIIINDKKTNGRNTAWAYTPERNFGIKDYSFLNLSEITKNYFKMFAEKDICGLKKLFSENIILEDWSGKYSGIDIVVDKNIEIFNLADHITVDIHNICHVNSVVYGNITVDIDNHKLPIVDVITFNSEGKISSIKAYKCA
tara:strand:+ start:3874 stop:4557 length:684 start_codon:yes stop_codon:yes gene_type:complete